MSLAPLFMLDFLPFLCVRAEKLQIPNMNDAGVMRSVTTEGLTHLKMI